MKTSLVPRAAAIVSFVVFTAKAPLMAQGRDTLARARLMMAVVRAPTVIAIGDTTQAERPFNSIRAAVDSLGFVLLVFSGPVREVVDDPHHAVYFVPPDLTTGYVIITPGRRPVTISGLVGADSLRARVRAYLRLTRPLDGDRSEE